MKKALALFVSVICIMTLLNCTAFAESEKNIDVFDDSFKLEHGLTDADGMSLYIKAAEWDGNILYAYMTDNSVYTYEPGGAPKKLCELPPMPEDLYLIYDSMNDADIDRLHSSVTDIAAYNGSLYGLNVYSGKFGIIDGDGVHWNDTELNTQCLFSYDYFFPDTIFRCFLTDKELFAFVSLSEPEDDTFFTIYGFDLSSGESRKLGVEGLCAANRMDEDTLLCMTQLNYGDYRFCTLDLATGNTEDIDLTIDIFPLMGDIGGLAYDPNTDAIFIAANNRVYRSVSGNSFEVFAGMPTEYIYPQVKAWILPDGRYALYFDAMHIREESEVVTELDENQLTFSGSPEYSKQMAYQNENPDMKLVFYNWMTSDDIARLLITRDESIDIYIAPADYAFASMKEKGLAAPLSSSEIIKNDVMSMDESIRSALCDKDGQIVAYPERLLIQKYEINEGYWTMLWPERPLPNTFDEVLDAWIDWERELSQDYPGVGFIDMNFDYADWIYTLVRAYVMQNDSVALPDLQSDALKSALGKLKQIRDIRVSEGRGITFDEFDPQLDYESETGPGLIFRIQSSWPLTARRQTSTAHSSEYLYGVLKGNCTERHLTFGDSSDAQTDAALRVFVVNPYSRNADKAIRFIECMTGVEADYRLYYAIHPNENEPYEDPSYEATLQRYKEMQEKYSDAIQKAKDAGGDYADLEYFLSYYNDWIEDEGSRWLVSEDTLAQYRAMVSAAPINVHAASPYVGDRDSAAGAILTEVCQRYAAGGMTVDGFLNEIAQKMKMIYLENQ